MRLGTLREERLVVLKQRARRDLVHTLLLMVRMDEEDEGICFVMGIGLDYLNK